MTYLDFQRKVFDYLWSQHQKDSEFRFSVRQVASKGAEANYFIGTQKSKYFGFTFWDIPVYFAGSAADLTNFFFRMGDDGSMSFRFQYSMTKSPQDEQNKADLEMGYRLQEKLQAKKYNLILNPPDNKMLYFEILPSKQSYTDFTEMMADFDAMYNAIAPVVDESVAEVKNQFPEWKSGRFTEDRFNDLVRKMHSRVEKYSQPGMMVENDDEHEDAVALIPASTDIKELSLNMILYGPPGTGKTYKLNQYKEQFFIDRDIAISSEALLRDKVTIYPFWKILGAVIGDSTDPVSVTDLLSNPLIKAKINPTAKTPRNTLWRILQSYADESSTEMDSKYKGPIQLFHKNEDSRWSIIDDKRQELADIIEQELLDIAANPITKPAQSVRLRTRFNFITFHQKYSYEDFIEGIKPLLRDKEIEGSAGDLQFELKKGIFYNSCLEALKLVGYESFEQCYTDTFENRAVKFKAIEGNRTKQFALFIDEINRANISAVFGELITLLEDDKRMGAENEMWVELPYTNEKFCVPANLYVIGTMNTADRSIALLDIALRRRFEFKALYPLYNESEWWAPLLERLNQAIHNWKKNPDFFIGHAFFINKLQTDRARILNTKVIPLLYEYCQSNGETVKRILTEAGIPIKPTDIKSNFQIIAE